MAKTKYFVETEGAVFTRKSDRVYQYAVAVKWNTGKIEIVGWCGRLDLAVGVSSRYRANAKDVAWVATLPAQIEPAKAKGEAK